MRTRFILLYLALVLHACVRPYRLEREAGSDAPSDDLLSQDILSDQQDQQDVLIDQADQVQPDIASPDVVDVLSLIDASDVADASVQTVRFDINRDGRVDVAVGAPGANRVYIFLGTSTGLNTTATVTLTGPEPYTRFGAAAVTTGDFDRDGFADLAIGAPDAMSRAGQVYVYLSEPTGLNSTPVATLSGTNAGDLFGSVLSTGDLDLDGRSDLAVGAPGAGRVYVFRGDPAGVSSLPSSTLNAELAGSEFGAAVAIVGDVDMNGYPDLLVGAPGAQAGRGAAYLFTNNASGLATSSTPYPRLSSPSAIDAGTEAGRFGAAVAAVGDLDGDGRGDVIIGAPNAAGGAGRAYIFRGAPSGVSGLPSVTLAPFSIPSRYTPVEFGSSLARGGDLDGDGALDLVVGARGSFAAISAGAVSAYEAADGGTVGPMVGLGERDDSGAFYGAAVAIVGDVDHDGFSDLVCGSPGSNGGAGRAFLYRGGASGVSASATSILVGAEMSGEFGASIGGSH